MNESETSESLKWIGNWSEVNPSPATNLNGLLRPEGWTGIFGIIEVRQKQRIDQRRFAETWLTWNTSFTNTEKHTILIILIIYNMKVFYYLHQSTSALKDTSNYDAVVMV